MEAQAKYITKEKTVVERIGLPALFEQTAEECMELAHALLKYARKIRGENPTPKSEEEILHNVIEEMADVRLCLDEIDTEIFTDDERNEMFRIINRKQERWYKRLEEAGK